MAPKLAMSDLLEATRNLNPKNIKADESDRVKDKVKKYFGLFTR